MTEDVRTGEIPIPLATAITTYFSFGLLMAFGHLRDFFRICRPKSRKQEGYAPLLKDFEDFFTRRMYHRIQDCWNRPVSSCPGAWIDVLDRDHASGSKPPQLNGKTIRAFNIGSYNYLGFGDPDSPTKADVARSLEKYSVSTCSPRGVLGTTAVHVELEELLARFVGKEASMVYGMGFGTNAAGIPAIAGKGDLIISDSMNHASIVFGCRASGASVKVFKHNDAEDLEAVLRRSIIDGQPRTRRPWKKIIVCIEGIYSMEGEIPPLRAIIRLKKKYKFYLYIDEAHSIGALGRRGRGVCEHAGVDPADVDILMGTFTKAFGSVGGYIAGDKALIDYCRSVSYGELYCSALSPVATQQVVSALRIMMGEDGTNIGREKLLRLRENSNMFRKILQEMGVMVLGDWDSPVCPIVLYNPGRLPAFSRMCLERGIATVVVGFPATPLLLGRSRICISAAHERKDLLKAAETLSEVCDELGLRFFKRGKVTPPEGVIYDRELQGITLDWVYVPDGDAASPSVKAALEGKQAAGTVSPAASPASAGESDSDEASGEEEQSEESDSEAVATEGL